MSSYDLPTSAVIGGTEHPIRSDYRVILDIIKVIGDPEIGDAERTDLVLSAFFPDYEDLPPRDFQEALEYVFWFVGGGAEQPKAKKPKLMDWEQDFTLIVAPVNRVLGYEVRGVPYDFEANTGGLHWWTFLSAYYEIGDCTFAQVVSIRKKQANGKKLDKADEAFYRQNRDLVDMRKRVTASEEKELEQWIKG